MNRFRTEEMRTAYDSAVTNYRNGKYGTPENRIRGASHRAAFWDGYDGQPNMKWPTDSMAYANYRAGQDLAKGEI